MTRAAVLLAAAGAIGALGASGCGGGAVAGSGRPGDAGSREADASPADGAVGGADAHGDDAPTGDDAAAPIDAHGEAPVEAEASGPPARLVGFASGYGPGIQWLSVDTATGAITPAGEVTSFGTAPSFLAVDAASKHLYAVDENTPGQVGAYSIDATTGALTFQNAVASGGDGPPYVGLDPQGKWVLVANYTSGTVAVLPVKADGSLGAAVHTASPGQLAHMMVADPADHFVFVPCKGSDYVAQYVFDASTGNLTANQVPTMATAAGAGPRHLAFHPNGTIAYLVNETDSTVEELSFDALAGTLAPIQTASTLAPGFTGTNTAAEVHVHPSGAWLFVSNRGDDSIATFPLDASGRIGTPTFTKSGGATPRDFALDPTGTFLYAANETTGNVVAFRFDAASGTLTPSGSTVTAAMASFVGLFPLP
ncbi:MAG TPA: beta-propeller fold lactonase family protein [Polyangiaceae bacterium]